MNVSSSVTLVDVGPRDGIQNEATTLTVAQKVELINRLTAAHVPAIEFGSFVNPKRVPQMAGAGEVFAQIDRSPQATYHALVPNQRGYENARDAGVKNIRLVIAASEPLNQANFRRSVDESLADHKAIIDQAGLDSIEIEATIAGSFGDPFIGPTAVSTVLHAVRHYYECGVRTVTVADTVGMGTPKQVHDVISTLKSEFPDLRLGIHLHDTRGTGLANVITAMDLGVTQFDASVGGIGGCPFAPKATGNLCSEELLHMMAGMGVETGVDLDAMIKTSRWMEGVLGKALPSKFLSADPVYPVFHPPTGC